ncbi:hypothetical protein V6N13_133350 [Hibiscus sabdariffa]
MLNQEIGTSGMSTSQNPLPMVLVLTDIRKQEENSKVYIDLKVLYGFQKVTVETLEKGFLINVFLEKNCPGLLVSILETFEELGLDVLDARVSCEDNFQLEAIGGENQSNAEGMDAQMVKQAVMQAINKWTENI